MGQLSQQNNCEAIVTIAQNTVGIPIRWSCKRCFEVIDPLVLEALTCIEAASLATTRGLQNVI